MKIEHFAINVADPAAVAAWYGKHCGLRVVRVNPGPALTHFLADDETTVLEIYCNPPDAVPDYKSMNPLLLHLALQSTNAAADSQRLIAAGATTVEELRFDDGSHLVMLRDPWGLALQLCQRATALLPEQKDAERPERNMMGQAANHGTDSEGLHLAESAHNLAADPGIGFSCRAGRIFSNSETKYKPA